MRHSGTYDGFTNAVHHRGSVPVVTGEVTLTVNLEELRE